MYETSTQNFYRKTGAVLVFCLLLSVVFGLSSVRLYAQAGLGDSTRYYLTEPTDSLTSQPDTSDVGTVAIIPFSREQEDNYLRALRLRLPPSARFRVETRMFSEDWLTYAELLQRTPGYALRSNLDVPDSWYIPSEQQRLLYQEQIAMSRYIPGIGLRTSPGFTGFQLPLSTIGRILGLVEDVSPTISYAVEYPTVVEAVVYSTQAKVVAIMFKGNQQPGQYALTWNGRDEQGKPLPGGDYIAEVRIGQETIVRKRMQIP